MKLLLTSITCVLGIYIFCFYKALCVNVMQLDHQNDAYCKVHTSPSA